MNLESVGLIALSPSRNFIAFAVTEKIVSLRSDFSRVGLPD
jgi:hypothetical protein